MLLHTVVPVVATPNVVLAVDPTPRKPVEVVVVGCEPNKLVCWVGVPNVVVYNNS